MHGFLFAQANDALEALSMSLYHSSSTVGRRARRKTNRKGTQCHDNAATDSRHCIGEFKETPMNEETGEGTTDLVAM